MLQGIYGAEIFRLINDPTKVKIYCPLSYHQIFKYVKKVKEEWRIRAQRSRAEIFSKHIAQREALYRLCLTTNDLRGALEVLKDIANLQGLYTTRHEIALKDTKNTDLSKLSTDQLRKLLMEDAIEDASYEVIENRAESVPDVHTTRKVVKMLNKAKGVRRIRKIA